MLCLPEEFIRVEECALEHELQRQLTLPGTDAGAGDQSELGIADEGVRCSKHGMVEGVLEVETQFQLHSFILAGEAEVLGNGQIGRPEEGRANAGESSRRIAEGVSGRQLEGVGIRKILVNPTGFRSGITSHGANDVGPLLAVRRNWRSTA